MSTSFYAMASPGPPHSETTTPAELVAHLLAKLAARDAELAAREEELAVQTAKVADLEAERARL